MRVLSLVVLLVGWLSRGLLFVEVIMIEYDETYYPGLKLTPQERAKQCREEMITALAAHLPTPMPVSDLLVLYSRYYRHTKTLTHHAAFMRFLHTLENERLVLVEYTPDEMPVLIAARRSRQTRELLGLPECLVKTTVCHDRGCRHREDCTVHYLQVQTDLQRAG